MNKRNEKGFTIVELAIVIGLIGMIVTMFAPKTIKSWIWEKQQIEQSYVEDLSDRFKEGVLATKSIPDHTTWNTFLSTYSGGSPSQILVNKFGNNRIFVFPDNFFAPASTLPYNQATQHTAGTFLTAAPANPRVMIISNASKNVLATTSGVMAAATFDAIWSQDTLSASFVAELTEGAGLRISKIQLGNEFKSFTINNNDTVNTADFMVDGLPVAMQSIPVSTTFTSWIFNTSQAQLFDTLGVMTYQHTINNPASFAFLNDWGSVLGATVVVGGVAGGSSAIAAAGFDPAQDGLLTTWAADPTCSPTGTTYTLTVDVQNQNEDWLAYAGIGGTPTYLGKIKSGNTGTFNVDECEFITLVPRGNGSTNIYMYYMPHNNYTQVIP